MFTAQGIASRCLTLLHGEKHGAGVSGLLEQSREACQELRGGVTLSEHESPSKILPSYRIVIQ